MSGLQVVMPALQIGKTLAAKRTGAGRVQLRRVKGWRQLPDTLRVSRDTRWGNPFRPGDFPHQATAARWGWPRLDPNLIPADTHEAVQMFARQLLKHPESIDAVRGQLGGRVLGCWCAIGEPCHADLLMRVANAWTKAKAIEELEAATC